MATKTKFAVTPGPATREAFGKALLELGKENKDIVVCDADLSKSTHTHLFAKEFPERFFSCGIAEANMVALGAGLSSSGKIAFVTSFSAFALNKGFEQLRVTVAYPNVNVKVVGTHSGISIGEDGPSQMSIEDLALAGALPGFAVLSPADGVAMTWAVRAAAEHVGPVFIRAGRAKAPVIYSPEQRFEWGKAVELTQGSDIALVANGLLVAEALQAADVLEADGISVSVIDILSVKPLDRAAIQRAAATGAIVVAEEHLSDCGLGVRVAQVVAETQPCIMEFVGLTGYAESGSPDELLDKYGMRAANIVAAAHRALKRKNR